MPAPFCKDRRACCLQVISVVAFRGQNRSEAQYVVSNSPGRTDGTGIVQQVRTAAEGSVLLGAGLVAVFAMCNSSSVLPLVLGAHAAHDCAPCPRS